MNHQTDRITGLYSGRVIMRTANPPPEVYHLACTSTSVWADKDEVNATLCGREVPDMSLQFFDATRADLSDRRLCKRCNDLKLEMLGVDLDQSTLTERHYSLFDGALTLQHSCD